MPYIYPPAAGTLTGDTYSASRFLNQPTLVQRALRTIAMQRFVSDYVLSGRIEASGGSALYEVSESIYTVRTPEPVNPGANYPQTGANTPAAALAAVTKWGQGIPITDEEVGRLNFGVVQRALTKTVNQMVRNVDGVNLAAIGAAVTQTQAATATWATLASRTILQDLNLTKAKIIGLNQGYDPDTLLVDDTRGAYLLSDDKLLAGMTREAVKTPTVTGMIPVLAGLRILVTPNLPAGVFAMVLDSKALGSVVYERIPSPGYNGDPRDGIETKIIRQDENDQWLIQARRPIAPAVQEPNSACVVTGV
jgi:hypothetical protein